MSWIVLIALAVALLGGGTATVYAADSAAPGDALYTVDRAVEALQSALTPDPEARAHLALAHAEERLLEAQALIARGADPEDVQVAIDGYGESISQAAQALAEVASTGETARAEALAALLDAALSVHEQVLAQVAAQAPETAASFLQQAAVTSQAGRKVIEQTFAEGMPRGKPDEVPGAGPEGANGPPEVPGGAPEGAPGGRPEEVPGAGGEETGSLPSDFERRISGLQDFIEAIGRKADEGDASGLAEALAAYENEVDSLAQELAQVATQDEARAQALVVLLDEALSQHSKVLTEVLARAPEASRAYLEQAITFSDHAREQVIGLFGEGMPGGDHREDAPSGPPAGTGGGRP